MGLIPRVEQSPLKAQKETLHFKFNVQTEKENWGERGSNSQPQDNLKL